MREPNTKRVNTSWRIFAVPLFIGLFSLVGLLGALLGDGLLDVVSWAGLAVPVVIVGWAMKRKR
ncbi:hypothetical protein [Alloalcanivorax mobilis]|uniref:hypothetical protein n=1 Tax=Alloalcanivorax mobilis TaxID=2019569 RepID=UPI000B5B3D31|nr:hypothetical protein [Alloalcanivorax mobilis]ASK33063.1 hypothetical protein CEK62_01025 [Alcanivorax sp. N3-2A]ASK36881.1 hypothetical protein CEK62_21220 [Alcanivorax sp. N3-2A]|tara:strand:- start:16246 stop:16437 length:192 start_codon:yes stop_codon:yes gene_type:complete